MVTQQGYCQSVRKGDGVKSGLLRPSHPSFHWHNPGWGGFSLLGIQLIAAVGVFFFFPFWETFGEGGVIWGLAGFCVAAFLLPGVI